MDNINLDNFKGKSYRLANNWSYFIPLEDKPINYLEIGTFYGGNLISVSQTYGKHQDSKLYCIDPWKDYEDYPEYKDEQDKIFSTFKYNITTYDLDDKVTIIRGYSNEKVLTLEDNYFDIIYIDGNHEPEYVLEDAVLCFRKLKVGGYLIFDDYVWCGPDLTQAGIDSFIKGYHKRIKLINIDHNTQTFIQKIR